MMIDITSLQKNLCEQFCKNLQVSKKTQNMLKVWVPFYFPDGDPYQIYLTELDRSTFRISDMGHTLMHLSYENDIRGLRKGTRKNILNHIKLELGLEEDNGAFYIDSSIEHLSINIFNLVQGITKIYDLTFLNKTMVQNTFYEDLREDIYQVIDKELITERYINPKIERAEDYTVDYRIQGASSDVYFFGISNNDKLNTVTLTLERLKRFGISFQPLAVFGNERKISRLAKDYYINVAGRDNLIHVDSKQWKKELLEKTG